MKHMPKVMQDQFKKSGGSRSFSTSARSRQPDVEGSLHDDASAALLADMIQQVNAQAIERNPGLKFDAPEVPAKTMSFRKRYDSLQEQFTKMLMQDGKLARAQNVCHPRLTPQFYPVRIPFNTSFRICLSSWTTFAPLPLPTPTPAALLSADLPHLSCLLTLFST
jgi:hypothetical protein